MHDIEIWKAIEGHDGYEVSSLGRVRSFWTRGGRRRRIGTEPWMLRLASSRQGYQLVVMRGKTYGVSPLVARAFLGDPPTPAHEVNHKQPPKSNDAVSNLEYVTHSENVLHAYRTGLMPDRKGENSARAKLDDEKVLAIRRVRTNGAAIGKIAADFQICETSVRNIVSGKSWSHLAEGK
jgi:hypothetical protein